MARKASASSESSHGFNDIIGVVLMGIAVLLLVALFSYHPRDVSANIVPTNPPVRNWIGPFGAWMAYYCFLWAGAAAYIFPVLLFLSSFIGRMQRNSCAVLISNIGGVAGMVRIAVSQ